MTNGADTLVYHHPVPSEAAYHPSASTFTDPTPHASTRRVSDVEEVHRERLKELNYLFAISQLVEQHRDSLKHLLESIVETLPSAWQYAEICSARLILHGQQYVTTHFQESSIHQSAAISVNGESSGTVEVHYDETARPLSDDPFLPEEYKLLKEIAKRVGKIVERFQIERQLRAERTALEEANAALRNVLGHIEEEKREVRRSILANVEKVLMPLLHALGSEVPAQQRQYVNLLKRHLEEIVSPFVGRLSKAFAKLTPTEIEICNMIRFDMSTKEIARMRHVAPATVAKQRERIRRKLDLARTKMNLATYLQTFSTDAAE